ncbi:MAG: hypothetical protein KDA55_14685, partial [Planctomycetales bacterium]|nr:hypothetical protein [Planctomycetales bacterium]
SVPILFDAGNDANLGSGGFFEKDVVTLVGSGIVLDLVHEHEVRGVESIDIRGDGSNTLILD